MINNSRIRVMMRTTVIVALRPVTVRDSPCALCFLPTMRIYDASLWVPVALRCQCSGDCGSLGVASDSRLDSEAAHSGCRCRNSASGARWPGPGGQRPGAAPRQPPGLASLINDRSASDDDHGDYTTNGQSQGRR